MLNLLISPDSIIKLVDFEISNCESVVLRLLVKPKLSLSAWVLIFVNTSLIKLVS